MIITKLLIKLVIMDLAYDDEISLHGDCIIFPVVI